jgi:hypothetical protein
MAPPLDDATLPARTQPMALAPDVQFAMAPPQGLSLPAKVQPRMTGEQPAPPFAIAPPKPVA